MSLAAGQRIGTFEILGYLGAGGMGEVYRGRDTALNRDVAIQGTARALRARRRAARALQAGSAGVGLAQPSEHRRHFRVCGIGPVPGLGVGGRPCTGTELVEGPTLADRLAQGPIPVDEALPIARQIAEGLEAAHEQGIIHRDLKPANIKLRPDGRVKVLDFGLAKVLEPVGAAAGDVTASPTITSPAMTAMGLILGTAAYMSPEQAKGRKADKRSDVWAFGAVLYEMLSGRRAFGGDDLSDTLAAVLKSTPTGACCRPTSRHISACSCSGAWRRSIVSASPTSQRRCS